MEMDKPLRNAQKDNSWKLGHRVTPAWCSWGSQSPPGKIQICANLRTNLVAVPSGSEVESHQPDSLKCGIASIRAEHKAYIWTQYGKVSPSKRVAALQQLFHAQPLHAELFGQGARQSMSWCGALCCHSGKQLFLTRKQLLVEKTVDSDQWK